jgi:NADH dehydrogenase/NADH:ubiquinone oxidoreductase subunit G
MIAFTIDGKEVKGEKDWTILEAARWHGIEIPTLCFHEAVEPSGACRLCLVEVDDGKKSRVVASCLFPVREGIRVLTATDRIKNARRWILEMLLAECPGSEKIRNLARSYGVKTTRFKTLQPEEMCVLCGLCVKVCEELTGSNAISFSNRGARKKIATPYVVPTPDCVGCGLCITVCPTGAMDRLFDQVCLSA